MPEVVELYKKYRPKRWNGVIGQNRLVNSLRQDIITDSVPNVYIFAGDRGCGKTTLAKIVAKAINCENRLEDGNPCNKCDTCKRIDEEVQLGVEYVSMANKGSVEDVRDIVNRAHLSQPVKRSVFILDEVHNIHQKAWDSLLIPLEDPKMKALFILCTTEVGKIPKTITSRSPARKLSLVSPVILEPYLKKICEMEKIEATEEILKGAIRLGRGSVRDTLTQLQVIVKTGHIELTFSDKLFDAMAAHDLPECLKVIAEASSEGTNFRDFTEQTFEDLGTLLLISAGVTDIDLVGYFPSEDPKQTVRGFMGPKGITYAMNEFGDALTRMSAGVDSKVMFEVALVKVVSRFAAAASK